MKNQILVYFLIIITFSAFGQWTTGTNIYNTNSGNVGIGKSPSSAFKLDVAGKIYSNEYIRAGRLIIKDQDASNQIIDFGYNGYMHITHGNNPADDYKIMTFVGQGRKVGIGTTNPYNKLDVGTGFSFHDGGHKIIGLGMAPGSGGTSLQNGYSAEIRLDPTSGQLSFGTSENSVNAGESPTINSHFTISNSGKIGIGTSPNSDYDVWVNRSFRVGRMIQKTVDDGNEQFDIGYNDKLHFTHGGDYSRKIITIVGNGASGRVGIGTDSPSASLEVIGSTFLNKYVRVFDYDDEGTSVNLISRDGNLTFFSGGVAIGSYSNNELGSIGTGNLNVKGKVNIGTTTTSAYKLNVNGDVRANEIVVNTNGADFVFEEGYKLRTLKEVEQFIKDNKHLPEIASAAEMQENGVGVSELQTQLLQKVEELTLYLIEVKKELNEVKAQNKVLTSEIERK